MALVVHSDMLCLAPGVNARQHGDRMAGCAWVACDATFCLDVQLRAVGLSDPLNPMASKAKVRAIAYRCVAHNGIVWPCMGARHRAEPGGGEAVVIQKALRERNWFQALEEGIDTSHLGFLHLGSVKPETVKPGTSRAAPTSGGE